jgi:hypothetical protein
MNILLLFMFGLLAQSASADDSLLAHWHLDEVTGLVA